MNRLLHTPEGVRDIYNEECFRKKEILSKLTESISSFGYDAIQTPSFEFFDVFSNEIGTTPSKDLFKFFDREGNTLVLRPDFTPSIARCAATYFSSNVAPIRLYYEGNIFINNHSYQGRLKENTQLGAEYIGENTIDADSEILSMVVYTLKAAELKNFQISLSHSGIFRGLMKYGEFEVEDEEIILDLIRNKNFFGLDEILTQKNIDASLKNIFMNLSEMFNTPQEWEELLIDAKEYPEIYDAFVYLKDLDHLLKLYGVDSYISYELGLVSHYNYYTGIIFSGYTYGSGQPIVSGGRYDELISNFGKRAPAIGFALDVDALLIAMERQKIAPQIKSNKFICFYQPKDIQKAIQFATEKRNMGEAVLLLRMSSVYTTQFIQQLEEQHREVVFIEDTHSAEEINHE